MTKKKLAVIICILGALIGLWIIILRLDFSVANEPIYGVQFSKTHAEYLGLDWQQTYLALLDGLKVDHLRLAAYWNEIEAVHDVYDFSDLDWLMNEAMQRDVKVILAIGERLPRWPECHPPEWARNLPAYDRAGERKEFMRDVVQRYKKYQNLEFWQVENEPFLRVFGECERMPATTLKAEIELVKQEDSARRVITTDSGELSWWRPAAKLGDVFGTTMYTTIWSPVLRRYFSYDWIFSPASYRLRAWWSGKSVADVFVIELQAEPWLAGIHPNDMPLAEQYRSLNPERFQHNLALARKTGFPRVYLWGSEWWYWLKLNGNEQMWKTVGLLWRENDS